MIILKLCEKIQFEFRTLMSKVESSVLMQIMVIRVCGSLQEKKKLFLSLFIFIRKSGYGRGLIGIT